MDAIEHAHAAGNESSQSLVIPSMHDSSWAEAKHSCVTCPQLVFSKAGGGGKWTSSGAAQRDDRRKDVFRASAVTSARISDDGLKRVYSVRMDLPTI